LFNCPDLYHKLPDSGERQYTARIRKSRFDPALRAGGTLSSRSASSLMRVCEREKEIVREREREIECVCKREI